MATCDPYSLHEFEIDDPFGRKKSLKSAFDAHSSAAIHMSHALLSSVESAPSLVQILKHKDAIAAHKNALSRAQATDDSQTHHYLIKRHERRINMLTPVKESVAPVAPVMKTQFENGLRLLEHMKRTIGFDANASDAKDSVDWTPTSLTESELGE